MKKIRIGSGAGYAGDRIEPAVELMEKGNLDYIIFECLAERTVAIGQQDKEKDPSKGYNQLLDYRMEKILPLMAKNKVKVITNMGAANPVSAAERTCEIARKLGVGGLKIACVTGDDITDELELGSLIHPKYITTDRILQYTRATQNSIGSNVETLYHILDSKAEALEFVIRENSSVVGVELKDLRLKNNLLVGCINRGGKVLIPRGDDCLMVGDTVVVVTSQKCLRDIEDILEK